MINCDNELCEFKLLQIVPKERDEDEYKEGEATLSDAGVVIGGRHGSTSSNTSKTKIPFFTTIVYTDGSTY